MARSQRLVRSQNAHFKLRNKAYDMPGKKGELLYRYHRAVLGKQKTKNRILTKKERRSLFLLIAKRVNKR